jgi:alanine racemase
MSPYRPVWVEIDLGALRRNVRRIKKFLSGKSPHTRILAVVKTDAYGHGLLPISQACAGEKVDSLGVTSVEEGLELRQSGIKQPILILGTLFPFDSFREVIEYGLTPVVASSAGLTALNEYSRKEGKRYPFHLKVDTGMGRIGISPASVPQFLRRAASLDFVKMEGIFTHFSSADNDAGYTRFQFSEFKKVIGEAKKTPDRIIYHCSNSSAMLRFPGFRLSMVRPGLCIYGLKPFRGSDKTLATEPVLSWKARIVFIKKVLPGRFISYGKTYKAMKNTVVATVPVGYGDGYRRSLSNSGEAMIRGIRVPVIGMTTMDMTMFDVTTVPGCAVGDVVNLIGGGKNGITVEELAGAAGTNNYETVCGIHPRINRIYLNV